jgi:hypothetical protein
MRLPEKREEKLLFLIGIALVGIVIGQEISYAAEGTIIGYYLDLLRNIRM